MAFDPRQISRIQFGGPDYPSGEAILGEYGWHVCEAILDDDGYWNDEFSLSIFATESTEQIVSKFATKYYLEFDLECTWEDFLPFIEQFGTIGKNLSGSLNGEDFEDLMAH